MKDHPVAHQRAGSAPSSPVGDPKHPALHLVIRHKEVLDLADEIWTDIGDVLERLVGQRLRSDGNETVILLKVPFVALLCLDRTDESARNYAANERRRIHQDQHIEWVPVLP